MGDIPKGRQIENNVEEEREKEWWIGNPADRQNRWSHLFVQSRSGQSNLFIGFCCGVSSLTRRIVVLHEHVYIRNEKRVSDCKTRGRGIS